VNRGVSRGQRGRTCKAVNLSFLGRNRYFFFQVAAHLSSQELSGPSSRPTATQKIWYCRESNPGPLGLQPRNLTTRLQRWSNLPSSNIYSKAFTVPQLGEKICHIWQRIVQHHRVKRLLQDNLNCNTKYLIYALSIMNTSFLLSSEVERWSRFNELFG
jgi:hypothetical protein